MSVENKDEKDNPIPHFINDPKTNAQTAPELKLFRPKINYFYAIIYIVIHFAAGILAAYIWSYIITEKNNFNLIDTTLSKLWITIPLVFLLTLRFTFVWFVRLYQRYAKSETRLRCCMTPSCSEYAILAFKKYGAIWGGIKTWKRLLRCHPPGGIDYP